MRYTREPWNALSSLEYRKDVKKELQSVYLPAGERSLETENPIAVNRFIWIQRSRADWLSEDTHERLAVIRAWWWLITLWRTQMLCPAMTFETDNGTAHVCELTKELNSELFLSGPRSFNNESHIDECLIRERETNFGIKLRVQCSHYITDWYRYCHKWWDLTAVRITLLRESTHTCWWQTWEGSAANFF